MSGYSAEQHQQRLADVQVANDFWTQASGFAVLTAFAATMAPIGDHRHVSPCSNAWIILDDNRKLLYHLPKLSFVDKRDGYVSIHLADLSVSATSADTDKSD